MNYLISLTLSFICKLWNPFVYYKIKCNSHMFDKSYEIISILDEARW